MRIHLGSDHGGFAQKAVISQSLTEAGHEVVDHGPQVENPSDDYPEFAEKVGNAVVAEPDSLGVLFCRSGEGMQMAANKVDGVRAALVWRKDVAAETRSDNNANIVVIPSDFASDEDATAIVSTFVATPFSGEERHQRRIDQITELEDHHDGS